MAHTEKKELALALRHKGESITEISNLLDIGKSTISYWCRDIVLNNSQIQTLQKKQEQGGSLGRLRAAEKKRATRLLAVETESKRGARDVGKLSARDLFMIGLALYWGEGYKSGNEECGFTNSDSFIIRAYIV